MLRNELTLQEQFLVRVSFLFAGGFLLAEGLQNWIRGKIVTHPEVVLLLLITYVLAFSLFVLATMNDRTVLKLRDLAAVSLVFATVASWYVITEVEHPGAYQTDALAFAHYAAILFSRGYNPYTQDLQAALAKFAVDPEFITLTPTGDLVSNLNYPALQFIFLLPVVWLGLPDARIVLYLFELAAIAVVYYWSPNQLKPLVLIPLFAGADVAINFTAGAVTEFLWVLPLVLMVYFMDRPKVAGVMFGMACAVKQTPWVLAPFLLIWYLKTHSDMSLATRARRVAVFAGSAFVTFLVPNFYFMAVNFGAWYSGVVTPAFGNLVVLSQGLSLITLATGVPLPPAFYLTATLAVAIVLLANYYTYFEKLGLAVWAFPAVILWFSYRGLQNYFIFWVPLLVMSAVTLYRRSKLSVA